MNDSITKQASNWVVDGAFVVDSKATESENRVDSKTFWENRVDDFLSPIGLSIEGFGNLQLRVDHLDKTLKLEVVTQNTKVDISHLARFPIDHVVVLQKWIPLVNQEVSNYQKFITSNGLFLGKKIGVKEYLILVAGKNEGIITVIFDGDLDFIAEEVQIKKITNRLKLEPYPYQQKGIDWLCGMRSNGVGAILGDEMGLGKTVQLLGLLRNELEENDKGKILIVVPSSLKLNWVSEFEKFLPDTVPYVHVGPNRDLMAKRIGTHNVVLTTYPILNRDYEILSLIDWTVIICDEAHSMKNPNSVTRKSINSFKKAPIFLSTGTPLENNLLDLWSLTDLIRPGLMGSLNNMKELLQNQIAEAENIGELVRPLIMRRLVKNVLPDLPELIEKTHWIEPSFEFTNAYLQVKKITELTNPNSSQFSLITKLRRFCTYPPMVGDFMLNFPDAKVDLLLDILDKVYLQGEKAIIFTSWHDSADFLKSVLDQSFRGKFCEVIDGREAADERFPKIVDFQSIDGFALLVCNTRAAGEGLNIVAANHVIHYDRQWNPAKEAQATGRSHRIGQKNTVFVHKLVYRGTIEEVIDDRLLLKAYLAQEILNPAVLEEDQKSIAEALGIQPTYIDNGA